MRATLVVAAAMALIGCVKHVDASSSSNSTVHSLENDKSEAKGNTVIVKKVEVGPGEEVITEDDFAPPDAVPSPAGSVEPGAPPSLAAPAAGAPSAPAHGPLLRHIVDDKKTGAVEADTTTHAETDRTAEKQKDLTAAAQAKSATVTDSKPAASCAFAGWMWGALILGALAGIIYFGLKLRPTI